MLLNKTTNFKVEEERQENRQSILAHLPPLFVTSPNSD